MSFIKVVPGLEGRNYFQKYLLTASRFIVPLVVSEAACYHTKLLYSYYGVLIATFRHPNQLSLTPIHLSHVCSPASLMTSSHLLSLGDGVMLHSYAALELLGTNVLA